MADLLLELYSEEVPARMQAASADNLARLLGERLNAVDLPFKAMQTAVTPMRLVAFVEGLPDKQPDRQIERKGPRADAPEKAIQGFLSSLSGLDYRIQERSDKKGTTLFAYFTETGRPALDVLAEEIAALLGSFPWPKSMRWGDHVIRWVRPLRAILCLLDEQVVPVRFGPLQAGATTRGHRFMAPDTISLKRADFAMYRAKLADAYVTLDPTERRARISEGAQALAEQNGLGLRNDPGLLDELTGLVEHPVPILGAIDAKFMALPPEVLTTSMRVHQKYLALSQADGALAPSFIAIANRETVDGGDLIRAGYERVLRARLWDADFFWQQDRTTPLADKLPSLDNVVFHAKLGTVGAKVKRLSALSAWLAQHGAGAGVTKAQRAALLAKADLTTGMVGEFPELQGVMGRYYAEYDGEAPDVAQAIAQHYQPQGPNDTCPSDPVAVTVALADKLDNLTGFFAISEKPTGSSDPFALRRAALGVIRLVLDNRLRLNLDQAVEHSFKTYRDTLPPAECKALAPVKTVTDEVLAFIAERLRVYLRAGGARHDLLAAVLGVGREGDLVRLIDRVEALQTFLRGEDGANLLTAYKRAANILRAEEKKDSVTYQGEPEARLLDSEAERRLAQQLKLTDGEIQLALAREDFTEAFTALAALRRPLDRFFDTVRVNDTNPAIRRNRLLLLNRIRTGLSSVAAFDLIEEHGQTA